MKSTIKWLVFVPVCLVSTMLMVFAGLASYGNQAGAGISLNTASEIVITAFLCMYLFFVVLSIFDKQTARVHLLLKNPFCGVTAMISAFALAANAALEVTAMARSSSFSLIGGLTALFTLLSAAALLFVAMNHFSGSNTAHNISVLYLALPLWCGIHLISRFLTHTADPVSAADTLDLVMYVALALFFMYSMMIHALIPGRNAVKSSVSVGFPAVTICFTYAATELIKVISSGAKSITVYLPAVSAVLIGLYVLGFTAELSLRAKSKDEVRILDDEITEISDDEEEAESSEETTEISEEEPEEVVEYFENVTQESSAETDDYDGFFTEKTSEPAPVRETQDYLEDTADKDSDTRSENKVIVEGEKIAPAVQKAPLEKGFRGATAKESIMIDDDFILAIDSSDARPERPTYDKNEDISSFILDNDQDAKAKQTASEEKYESRLDEIDKLIISIQGGEGSEDK